MPHATKSAVAVNEHQGDVRTHIFTINDSDDDKSAMWFPAGGKTYANGFVTLDFACYSCHDDTSGVGGGTSEQSLADLAAAAEDIHD